MFTINVLYQKHIKFVDCLNKGFLKKNTHFPRLTAYTEGVILGRFKIKSS